MIDIDEHDGMTSVWWRLGPIHDQDIHAPSRHLLARDSSRAKALLVAELVVSGELIWIKHWLRKIAEGE